MASFSARFLAAPGATPSLAVLDAASLAAAEGAQATPLAAGTGVSQSRLCLVLNGAPNGELFTLQLVVNTLFRSRAHPLSALSLGCYLHFPRPAPAMMRLSRSPI
jgi:hypothetical protein